MFIDGSVTNESIPDQSAKSHPLANPQRTLKSKAVVVGIYGVPGSGKTTLLTLLRTQLDLEHFAYYDGSEIIASVVPHGLDAFQKLCEKEKEHWRKVAIEKIRDECSESGKVGVVAGHFMFWNEGEERAHEVCTEHDLKTYTHIIYLDIPAETIAHRRRCDDKRERPLASVEHLDKWKEAEKMKLRRLCREHYILFSCLTLHDSFSTLMTKASMLLQDFRHHTEQYNFSKAGQMLDKALAGHKQYETALVFDADRTLAAVDTGKLFWEKVSQGKENTLKDLFDGSLGYSYTAFRQAVLLYEDTVDDEEFDQLCEDVAAEVAMHPEFVTLLHLIAEHEHVAAVIFTCGLRRIWDKILEWEGLSEKVSVIGGGRIADGIVVTAAVKAALVTRLQHVHHMRVWAFGDSPLDVKMLWRADHAVVVTGLEESRSKTMDEALIKSMDRGFKARQALIPSNATPRLDISRLPLIQIWQPYTSSSSSSSSSNSAAAMEPPETKHKGKLAPAFVDSILYRRRLQVFQATDRAAAQLLMTPTRDSTMAGPALREAHRRIGWYLAVEFLAKIIGLETYTTLHVQGHNTSGFRLLREKHTSVVALMRGGEPMAFGVNDAFPLAMFIHANRPDDVKLHHLQQGGTVVLVDSVVNSGKTVVDFVKAIRKLHSFIPIVVVAGVVQADSVNTGSLGTVGDYGNVTLVALRLSENKFTGRGTTDTGNRLFNTTHLA